MKMSKIETLLRIIGALQWEIEWLEDLLSEEGDGYFPESSIKELSNKYVRMLEKAEQEVIEDHRREANRIYWL